MLTQQQLDDIIDGNDLLGGATTEPRRPTATTDDGVKDDLRGAAFLETLTSKKPTQAQENEATRVEGNEFINKLRADLESKFERGEIGGTKDEKQTRMKERTLEEVKGSIEGTGDILKEGAGEILKAIPREMIRPFVSFIRGIQGLIPGGKEGTEPVDVPILGEIKPGSELTPLEAGLSALELTPGVGKPIVKAGEVVTKKALTPARVIGGKIKPAGDSLETILSPKMTITRRGELIAKGQVTEGEAFPLLGKLPDVVAPNAKEVARADVFRKYIDKADNANQFELVTKANKAIETIAKKVRPILARISFKPKDKLEIFNSMENIFVKQKKDPLFLTNKASNVSFQKQFKELIGKLNESKKIPGTNKFREWTIEDVWDLRIDYDKLVKDRVKAATSQSSDILQHQREMWVENRNVLNEWLIDKVGRQDFLDMSNLYDGINNIVRKGGIDTKGDPNIIMKLLPSNLRFGR